jgi:uncharacterized protein (DUF885 family)
MTRALILSLSLFFSVLASAAESAGTAEQALAEVISEYEQLLKKIDPISAGQEGDRDALRRWPDVRAESVRESLDLLARLRDRLSKLNRAELSAGSALNHALLVRLIEESLEKGPYDFERIAFNNDSGFHTLADYVARTTTIATREDADAWIARLEALSAYYEYSIENLRRGIRTKFTQPRIVIDRVLNVARQQAAVKAENHVLLTPFVHRPGSMPESAWANYRSRALELIKERIAPAQQTFVTFLEREYAPAARPKLGLRSVRNGEAMYRVLVRAETTTNLTPDEIHQIGVSEVQRIRALMEENIRSTGFDGSFAEFLQMLRTDARFYAASAEDLLEKASEIAKRADDRLPPLFGTLPRLPYGVRPVPAEIAEGYTTGRYWMGSMVQGQAGGYMVNTSRLDQRPLYELPALTLHEAVPGHHLQNALAQELQNLHYFRRNMSPTAFGEGWGLYSEFLGEEMGMYRDAYERFGRYSYEMWRACRLVADTGIHWLGWDIEQARRCFTENSALAPHNIQTELERYVSWPAQALAYKIGELRLRALREEAQRTLGERFNVREFHDLILLGGPLPLDVLEGRVKEWIATKHQ